MAKGAVTIKEIYASAQTDTVVESPQSGKSFIIINASLNVTQAGTATVKFATSGNVIAQINGVGSGAMSNLMMEGAIDEDIIITCPPGTTLILFFDEL